MSLPQTKEREHRFKLALRMGLPIFALILAFISNTLITTYDSLQVTFYIESILLLAFSIYFIFYLIYRGFDEKITEAISKTFTREYLYKYLNQELKREREYTLILISIDNLNDINVRYGIKNGDKILYQVAKYVSEYLESKNIYNIAIGHIKGGDFVIGLKGNKSQYNTILELFCLKSSEYKVDDIEVKISGAIVDTSFSNNLDYMIENLFEIQEEIKYQKQTSSDDKINPSELESFVINAIKNRTFILLTQNVFENDKSIIKECFVKLKTPNAKILHQKSYMHVINRLGLMVDFDLMVLERTIACINDNESEIFALTIAPTSLRNSIFLMKIKELIKKSNKIMFIINEQEYYSHIDKFNNTLKSLREMGILIAIDRLGAMHTSFLYMRDLEIDVVRFDSLLTKEIRKRNYNSIIIGFIAMAQARGIKTWMKMIESEDTKMEAIKLQVDYLQGKYLSELEKIYEK
ncbi:MAG: EAL domain-containing protein [Sulfurimonas sp.]|jgi:EAL domain-containing protein (putative c-di-GMP-specific phosphodiesterase class I)/GGDEF domain-containing protein